MSDKVGYVGNAKAKLVNFEENVFKANSGVQYVTYKARFNITQIWNPTTEEFEDYEDDDFNSQSLHTTPDLTLWLDPVPKEGKDKSSMQRSVESLEKAFDIEIKTAKDFSVQELTKKLAGRMARIKCKKAKNEAYTEVEFVNNIDYKPEAKIATGDDATAVQNALNTFFKS